MKRTPLKRKTPMKRSGFKKRALSQLTGLGWPQVKPRKRIRPVSKRRQKDNKEYTRLRKEFLAHYSICEVTTCLKKATQVHHKARRGKFYLRADTWLPVCAEHHQQIEENGEWAKANGYTLTVEERRLL